MRRISARERLVGRLPTAFAGALALGATIIGSIALGIGTAGAAPMQPAFADTFRIGNAGPVCEAQSLPAGATRRSVYDRKWLLLCHEVARPIGVAWFVRDGSRPVPGQGLDEALDCTEPGGASVTGLAGVLLRNCRGRVSGLEYHSYTRSSARGTYVVEGLTAFDSALQLTLRSLVTDTLVAGEISAASLGGGGGSSFFQVKAGAADADSLIGQGYRRNAAGAYAEAAQIFAAVAASVGAGTADSGARRHELTINQALQLSNLSQFDQGAALFATARAMSGIDPLQARLGRNFEAIDALNRGDYASVGSILDRPVPPIAGGVIAGDGVVEIDLPIAGTATELAAIISQETISQETRLTPAERAEIADAQATALRGTALRLAGKPAEARAALVTANARALAVRDGRVLPVIALRAQMLAEIARTYETEGNPAQAERLYRAVEALVSAQYPDSQTVNAARARLAGFMVRQGRSDEALTIYRALVGRVIGSRDALVGMSNLIQPYFDLLTADGATAPQQLSDLFLASQLVERPGAADSLSQLARQLEGGNSDAAALFRRSLAVSRDLERNRIQVARLSAASANEAAIAPQLAVLMEAQGRLEQAQVQLVDQLSAFAQYRAVANRYVTLEEMRASLKPGEGYWKLVTLGQQTYALIVTPAGGRGWKVAKRADEISALVSTLRDSISITVNGVRSTYPFDLDSDVILSEALLGPARVELAGITHLVFEPDGAMLQLPANLLVLEPAGVEAYRQRILAGGDEFDMAGVGWLGRTAAISTALSAASFRDARNAPESHAARVYLGLGSNQPLGTVTTLPAVRGSTGSAIGTAAEAGCDWPVATWNQPISPAELREAAGLFGSGGSDLMTGRGFTDSAIAARTDLADFRVIHFATHGLITAPRPGCPARPALLTSFGTTDSDGLLRFDEIFNLHLDADLVILSACDTAGGASLEATREAGVTSGGGQALDGLVRAFIAAGGRQVIASHWPAPDDYNATERLIGGFFADRSGTEGVAAALQRSQRALMDDPLTSHPFYWAGFAIVGDGERPLHAR